MFYGGDGTQLGVQLLGVVVILCWTISVSLFLFSFLKSKGWLRVPEADELAGLDASYHGGSVFDENAALAKAMGSAARRKTSPTNPPTAARNSSTDD